MRIPRIGVGYDSHRFADGRPLVLGGVNIPFPKGLAGHSDADVLTHALIDALLGALAAGDIGQVFPDTDEKWRGVSSMILLVRVVRDIRARGYRVGNIDAVIIAEQPRLAPHLPAIRKSLAASLAVAGSDVSVKGKTNEGMGALGAGEGMAAHVVVILFPGGPDDGEASVQ